MREDAKTVIPRLRGSMLAIFLLSGFALPTLAALPGTDEGVLPPPPAKAPRPKVIVETKEVLRTDPTTQKQLTAAEEEIRRLKSELAASRTSTSTSVRPPLPAARNIHGWSTKEVKELQESTAAALGRPVEEKPCDVCPQEVVIPPGKFQMGEEGRTHEVTISSAFAVGRTEVTFAEWDACVLDGGCSHKPDTDWGRGLQPVMRVSADDIDKQYLPWLNRKAGLDRKAKELQYRLLTESEWEYAARAGTTGPFSFAGPITWEKVNYDANYSYAGSPKGTYRQKTVAAGSLPANPWGLREVHGNVWEWVQDCWHDNYANAPSDGSAWKDENGGNCSRRVVRGGSWLINPDGTRSASRVYIGAVNRYNSVGFRLARTLKP